MLRVTIDEARPGMTLALPVHHPEQPSCVLLRAETLINERAISRLNEQNVQEIWVRWPGLEFIREQMNPALDQSHRELTRELGSVFDHAADDLDAEIEYASLKAPMSDVLEKLVEDPRAAVFLSDLIGAENPLLRHSSSVCLLSLLMGLKLSGYLILQRKRLNARDATNIVNLGVGALLHDIGMLHLSPGVAERFQETRDESDPAWREHVNIGFKMLQGRVEATASSSVLHHHQRYDGSGFPAREQDELGDRGLVGEEIHIFARIIAAADMYDRIRFPEDGVASCPRVRALRTLQQREYASLLDPEVLRALILVTPPYPPGSIVTLSTGDRAVVTSWSPQEPCRPEVQLIGDLASIPDEGDYEPRIIDLQRDRRIEVAYAEGENVLRDNFYTGGAAGAAMRAA